MGDDPSSQHAAIAIAKQVARDTYGDVEAFDVDAEERPDGWLVHFTNPSVIVDGEGQHFAVWVDRSTGHTRLFRGR
jgi:hypothetical protein